MAQIHATPSKGDLMKQVNRLAAYKPDAEEPAATNAEREFEQLLRAHETDLRSFVFTLLPNWSDVEDVLQRTRIVLWQKFRAFEPGTNFRAWALQIARHEVNNFRRNRQRDRLCFDDALVQSLAEVHQSLIHELEQRRAALEFCIQKLRASDRQIIQHCYGPTATTVKEAAERLRRPVNTLYKALNRIRRLLTECVQQKVQEEQKDIR